MLRLANSVCSAAMQFATTMQDSICRTTGMASASSDIAYDKLDCIKAYKTHPSRAEIDQVLKNAKGIFFRHDEKERPADYLKEAAHHDPKVAAMLRQQYRGLSNRGRERSHKWAEKLYSKVSRLKGVEVHVFAQEADHGRSTRPAETVQPFVELCQQNGLPMVENVAIERQELGKLTEELQHSWSYDQLTVVAWEHTHLAHLLGLQPLAGHRLERPWPKHDYDSCYILTKDGTLHQFSQNVLADDARGYDNRYHQRIYAVSHSQELSSAYSSEGLADDDWVKIPEFGGEIRV